jgi:hypothetical protein
VKQQTYSYQFVEFMPKALDEGVLYVSMTYATASHRCFCGCGMKVVTPLSPTDWRLTFDGDSVSLHPSIGNWSYPCRSHYILRGSRVVWAGTMSTEEVQAIRDADGRDKRRYYRQRGSTQPSTPPVALQALPALPTDARTPRGWRRVLDWFWT